MREACRRSGEYLETRKTGVNSETLQDALRRQLLLVAGFSAEEVESMDQSISDEEF
jgi:hypothetical protein